MIYLLKYSLIPASFTKITSLTNPKMFLSNISCSGQAFKIPLATNMSEKRNMTKMTNAANRISICFNLLHVLIYYFYYYSK